MFRPMLLALGLTLAAAPATAFLARNDLTVTPTGPDSFVVNWRGNSRLRAFWCAAADYARHELGATGQTRVYRTSGPRRPGQGISFSLSPDGARKTGLLIIQSDGTGLSVAHGEIFCRLSPRD
jgi:hypothetical protein